MPAPKKTTRTPQQPKAGDADLGPEPVRADDPAAVAGTDADAAAGLPEPVQRESLTKGRYIVLFAELPEDGGRAGELDWRVLMDGDKPMTFPGGQDTARRAARQTDQLKGLHESGRLGMAALPLASWQPRRSRQKQVVQNTEEPI
jgi:hypothetical protein